SYPLRLVSYLGLITIVMAALCIGWVVVDYFVNHTAPQGWASTVVVVLITSAVQLISLGIMGEYVRRIFLEVKGRPTYIVREVRPGAATEGVPPSPAAAPTTVSPSGLLVAAGSGTSEPVRGSGRGRGGAG